MILKTNLVLAIILSILLSGNADKTKYENYKIFRLIARSKEQVMELRKIQFDVLNSTNKSIDIILPPSQTEAFYNFVNRTSIEYKQLINNVSEHIKKRETRSTSGNEFNWYNYQSLDKIHNWLDSLPSMFPNVFVIEIGKSYEGRSLKGVKISYKEGNRGVFLEGGIHAREWISPATATFILHTLLASNLSSVMEIAENYDWYIFPVVNPDGYEYTFTNDRFWRKSRKPYGNCFGADLNRNWDFKWSEAGSSSNPCSDMYSGPKPFSEPESKALADFISSISEKLVAYITFHSYSQKLLVPYGHTSKHLENYNEVMEIGRKAIQTLKTRFDTKYDIGNVVELIYPATGNSMDWVKYNFKTPLAYSFELRDTGRYGFQLPSDQIIPTGLETMDAILTIMTEAKLRGLV